MKPLFALICTGVGIVGVCWIDRDKLAPISKAVVIPLVWLLICSSRPLTAWMSQVHQGDSYTDGSPLDRNLLTLLIILGVIVLSKRPRQVRSILRLNAPIIAFLLYCFVSIIWSDFPFVTFKRWIRGVGDIVMVL